MSKIRRLSAIVGSAAIAGMLMTGLSAPPPAVAAAAVDGSTETTAAASCWEIKQEHPASANGSYWVSTAEMDAPKRVYCDMTTDGGGWLLIGKGKQGWTENYEGKGRETDLQENGLSPMSGQTTQYSSDLVDGLLNGEPVHSLSDGVRLKRARTADGTQWQEVRFSYNNRDRWVWTFGAAHRTASTSFDGVVTPGGGTSNFGTDNAYNRVITGPIRSQGYASGFAYGSGVTGSSDNSSHLWSSVNGAGTAIPYTEMYIRPKIRSLDAGFERIGNAGTDSQTNAAVARSLALDSPWGVAGQGGPFQREGDIEVQAFVESGGLMYVGGNFRYAQRAAGSTGVDQVEQPFLAAFNVNNGELVRGFTPSLNGSVMALAALPNGNIVAAGTFTEANGAAATAIVALDPDTGNTAADWSVHVEDNRTSGVVNIRSLSVQGDWLYLAGGFTHVSGGSGALIYAQSAARVSVVDGTPGDGWRPTFNGTVVSADASEDGARLYAAGYFTTSQGSPAYKAAAVQTSANAPLATPAWNPVWSSANKDYQQAIGQVGDRVWVGGSEHSFFSYSTASFDRLSGNIGQRNGDFQAMTAGNGVVYAGCHCNNYNYSNSFTWPDQGSNWTQADAIGWIAAWDASTGEVIPNFTPTINTRRGSGVWASAVDSNGTLWAGGDLTRAATPSSQSKWAGGFARFPQTDSTAPSTPTDLTKSLDGATTVRLAWGASTDNEGNVSYQVLRNDRVIATTSTRSAVVPKDGENRFFIRAVDSAGNLSASTPVLAASGGNAAPVPEFSTTVDGMRVNVDASGSTDDGTIADYAWDFGDGSAGTGAIASHTFTAAGEFEVRLVVTDDGGERASLTKTVTITQPAPADAYGAAVYEDDPELYWRLGEQSGTVARDSSTSLSPGTYSGSVTQGVAGALAGVDDSAADFDGSSGLVASDKAYTNPTSYSLELWFNTTTTRGGKLIGFGNQASGLSSSYDRHVYMQDDGKLVFGVWTGTTNVITTPASYNDGGWHHVTATQSADGMVLYVDGQRVGTHPQTGAQDYTGYWRVGGDTTWGSSSAYMDGAIDEVAVYNGALTGLQVARHYSVGADEEPPVFTEPTDNYGAAVYAANPAAYWRLNDASGTVVADYSGTFNTADYNGGVSLAADGALSGNSDKAAVFDGVDDFTANRTITSNPTVYSLETWFKTDTTQGGKLIGFGNAATGLSTNYDRHIYMRDDGTLLFGTYTGQENTITTTGSYNDNSWHHVVATQSDQGMVLYVDGVMAGTNPQTAAQNYAGYWRLGGDRVWSGASSSFFKGTLDEAAVYKAALSAEEAAQHYRIGADVPPPPNQAPVAEFSAPMTDLTVAVDGSASTDPDGAISSYTWDFGDGARDTGATTTHTYAAAGTYSVTLTVTDNDGATNVRTAEVTATEPPPPVEQVAVQAASDWAWRFETGAPPADWKERDFDASGWQSGPAILGFGSADIATNIDIAGPATDRPRAAYFSRTFNVDDASKAVKLNLKSFADDGVVIYVNGTEVARRNMPTGEITHQTFASSAHRWSFATANPVEVEVPAELLVTGSNTIAAETHLNFRRTPDIGFELTAILTTR